MDLLKIGTPYPLPLKLVEELLSGSEKVLIVEELEAFVEMQVRACANKLGIPIPIAGKGPIPLDRELSITKVTQAVCDFLDIPIPEAYKTTLDMPAIPPRPPILCPGCGHRVVFHAMNIV